jgi:DHA3 family macrolide efflux protein-like MFS transporter
MVLFALGLVEVVHVLLALLLRSLFSGFHWTSMQASTTLMVPEVHFGRISGLNQSVRGWPPYSHTPLGAVLIAALPMYLVLSVDVITALIAVLSLMVVRIPEIRKAMVKGKMSITGDLREAWTYLRSWKGRCSS